MHVYALQALLEWRAKGRLRIEVNHWKTSVGSGTPLARIAPLQQTHVGLTNDERQSRSERRQVSLYASESASRYIMGALSDA